MTAESTYFIQILKDHLNSEKTIICSDIDWNTIQVVAKKHQLEGIVYYQTKRKEFRSAYSSTLYYAANRKVFLKEIITQIADPYFIVKGIEVASCYPIPELRTMGDCDLVVKNRINVHDVLEKLGYKSDTTELNWEWHYYKKNITIEVHDRLIYKEVVNDNDKQIEFFNNCWRYVQHNQLDWNFHFMFLLYHLKKHFMNSGVGFRQFMDIAVIIKSHQLDWIWIEKQLKEIGLLEFTRVVLAFINRWFAVEIPIGVAKIDDTFYECATAKILEDGVFGFTNDENLDASVINATRTEGSVYQLKLFLQRLFPSYRSMKHTSHYSFIEGKPYLLPIAWIYRLFYNRKNLNKSVDYLKSCFVSNEKIEKREQMYKQWGL